MISVFLMSLKMWNIMVITLVNSESYAPPNQDKNTAYYNFRLSAFVHTTSINRWAIRRFIYITSRSGEKDWYVFTDFPWNG